MLVKIKRGGPHQSARNFSSHCQLVFLTTEGSACPRRGTWKCNCSRVGREIGVALSLSRKRGRRNAFHRNTIDVMGGCCGQTSRRGEEPSRRMQEARRNTPGGPSTFPPSRRVARQYVILLTICPKAVKTAAFPERNAEAEQSGSDSYLYPGAYALLRRKFFTDDLFFLPLQLPLRRDGIVAVKVLCD